MRVRSQKSNPHAVTGRHHSEKVDELLEPLFIEQF
jgi:hypothetical protein